MFGWRPWPTPRSATGPAMPARRSDACVMVPVYAHPAPPADPAEAPPAQEPSAAPVSELRSRKLP